MQIEQRRTAKQGEKCGQRKKEARVESCGHQSVMTGGRPVGLTQGRVCVK